MEISIIIPIYNADKYLDETLSCVAEQTMEDIEIICVDDGSTDDSVRIIKSFADKDPRFKLLHCPHGGAGKARNMGMDVAVGEYLLFLDADDIFERTLCRIAVDRARITGADIVIFGSDGFDDNEKKRHNLEHLHYPGYLGDRSGGSRRGITDDVQTDRDRNPFETSEPIEHTKPFDPCNFTYRDIPDHIFNAFGSEAWNKLFRHDFIKNHNLRFQEIMRTNDMLFTFRALVLAERISLERSVLVHYRTGIPTSCQATTSLYPFDFYSAYKALRDYLDEVGIYDTVRRSFVNYCTRGCYHNIISQTEPGKLSMVYRFLHEKGFPELGFGEEEEAFFYDGEDYTIYDAILNDTLCEVFYNNFKSVLDSRRYRVGKAVLEPVKKAAGAIRRLRFSPSDYE